VVEGKLLTGEISPIAVRSRENFVTSSLLLSSLPSANPRLHHQVQEAAPSTQPDPIVKYTTLVHWNLEGHDHPMIKAKTH
jgi:hypothetical protein